MPRIVEDTWWISNVAVKANAQLVCGAIGGVLHVFDDESLKAYLAPTGLVSEPRGDLTCHM